MERSGEEGAPDLLDEITGFFVESGKSRRQVAKKMKDMGLIAVSCLSLWRHDNQINMIY
jgi:hypothetical protein